MAKMLFTVMSTCTGSPHKLVSHAQHHEMQLGSVFTAEVQSHLEGAT